MWVPGADVIEFIFCLREARSNFQDFFQKTSIEISMFSDNKRWGLPATSAGTPFRSYLDVLRELEAENYTMRIAASRCLKIRVRRLKFLILDGL